VKKLWQKKSRNPCRCGNASTGTSTILGARGIQEETQLPKPTVEDVVDKYLARTDSARWSLLHLESPVFLIELPRKQTQYLHIKRG